MKCMSIAAGLVALGGLSMSGLAAAACQGQGINATAASALSGKTLCVTKQNGDRFQEFHAPGGDLFDYKRGPGHAVDPTKKVGTWSAAGNNVVYTYGPGLVYQYTVYRRGNTNTFCLEGNGEEIRPSAVLDSQGACP